METFDYLSIFIFVLGLFWGSFLGLIAYRMPRDISIVWKRSYCENCNKTIPVLHLIPILGYILARGECKNCAYKIPILYPLVELFVGLSFFYAYEFLFYDWFSFARAIILVSFTVPAILTDISHRIIPDRISLGLLVAGFTLSLFDPLFTWVDSLIGIFVLGGFLYGVSALYYALKKIEGLGGGDIKYMAGVGALLGWYQAVHIVFIGSIVGAIFGVILLLGFKKNRYTAIAFGPFLGLAAILYHFIVESTIIG